MASQQHKPHAIGAQVRIDQGSNRFTLGIVEFYGSCVHPRLGGEPKVRYIVRTTGGVSVFGTPAQVGLVRYVNPSHVLAA